MSERLSDIVERIDNMHQLDAVVTAMRGIAASHVQQSRALIAGIDAYTAVVSRAIGEALTLTTQQAPEPTAKLRRPGLVLFAAEQGFAGSFSSRIIDEAERTVGVQLGQAHLMMIGTRGIGIAAERGLKPAWTAAMANRIDSVPTVANRIADALFESVAKGEVSEVNVFYCCTDEERSLHVRHTRLLPLELETFHPTGPGIPPLATLPPDVLLARLTDEYIYARLCDAAMHSFAAENEARTQAMSSASNNIDKALNELVQREHNVRQEEITAEILELTVGNEAQSANR